MRNNGIEPERARFALFLPDLGGGGAERVALALLQGFVERGYRVDLVLAQRRGALLPLVPEGVEIIDLDASKLRQAIVPLARYLRRRRPRALHAMMWPLPLIAVIARRIAGVETRIVSSEHTTLSVRPNGLRNPLVRRLTQWAYARMNVIVAVSAGVADDLSALIGLPRQRIMVIHNPLLLPATLPDPAQSTACWPGATKRILAIGALKSEKNYPLLLRALTQVLDHVPVSLLILGEGALRAGLEAQISEDGLEEAVVLAGFDADPWPYYAAADLFVLSSDCEGLPTVLIEALHAGLPIVSTDCPNGPREILADGRYGDLVKCGDVAALADAIVQRLTGRIEFSPADQRARALQLSGSGALLEHIAIMDD